MPLPNSDIVSAFFESYITIRKGIWNLDVNDNDSIKIPDSAKPVHKITICNEMLLKFKNAVTFEDWLAIVDDLYEKERAEKQTQDERYLLTRLFTNSPLLLDVLCAARTYIISEIKSEKKFKELKQELTKQKELLEKDILWQKEKGKPKKDIDDNQKILDGIINKLNSRDETVDYYITFFTNTITKEDPDSRKLDEKSFADFKKNVLNKSRPLILCKLLIESVEKKANNNHPISKAEHRQSGAVKDEVKSVTHSEKNASPQPAIAIPAATAPVTLATTPASVPSAASSPATAPQQPVVAAQPTAAAAAPAKSDRKQDKAREPAATKTAAKDDAQSSALSSNSTFTHRRPATYNNVVRNHSQTNEADERYEYYNNSGRKPR